MTIRPEKLVVTSNYSPEQCFSNPEDIGPIMRRFRVVDDLAQLPPIPDRVPPVLLQPWEEQPEAPLEQVVIREEQVSREADGGVQYQEDDLSDQRDQRCLQQ